MSEAFEDMKARDVAIAATSAIRIIIDQLAPAGPVRERLEEAFRTKAGELIGHQHEDNAANLLRMMAGVVQPQAPGA